MGVCRWSKKGLTCLLSVLTAVSLIPYSNKAYASEQEICEQLIPPHDTQQEKSFVTSSLSLNTTKITYEVASYEDLLYALSAINAATDDAGIVYTIELTSDIFPTNSVAGYDQLTLNVEKDTTVLGNGHTFNLGAGEHHEGRFHVLKGATLSFGSPDGGDKSALTVKGTVRRTDCFVAIGETSSNKTKGTCNIYDGVNITGISGVPAVAASVVLVSNGTFNMYGGAISGNTKESFGDVQGVVAHYNYGTDDIAAAINVYGGAISNNAATGSAEGFRAAVALVVNKNLSGSSASFTMSGGVISNQQTQGLSYGGGVVVYGPSVTGKMSGGIISGNEAYLGGGVYCASGAAFTMGGGTISNNKADFGGGVFQNSDKPFIMTGGEISTNVAKHGGGIAMYDGGGSIENASIKNNRAEAAAGILLDGAILNISNSEITGNISASAPYSGIFVQGAYAKNDGTIIPSATLNVYDYLKVTDNLGVDDVGGQINSNVYLAVNETGYENEIPAKINIFAPLGMGSIIGLTEEQAQDYNHVYIQNIASAPSANFTVGLFDAHGTTAGTLPLFQSDNPQYFVAESEDGTEARLAVIDPFDDPDPDPIPDPKPDSDSSANPKYRPIRTLKPLTAAPHLAQTGDTVYLWLQSCLLLTGVASLTLSAILFRRHHKQAPRR